MSAKFSIPKSRIIRGTEWLSERIAYPETDIKGDTVDGVLYLAHQNMLRTHGPAHFGQ